MRAMRSFQSLVTELHVVRGTIEHSKPHFNTAARRHFVDSWYLICLVLWYFRRHLLILS